MTTFKSRGQIIFPTEGIHLSITFRDFTGVPADLAAFPTISIIQPNGNVAITPTSAGVYRTAVGVYGFDYLLGINPSLGVWVDFWSGTTIDGYTLTGEFNFVVDNTDIPQTNSDGYVALGDDPGFNYSQVAIRNINKCIKALKARLNSSGKSVSYDSFGNQIYVNCDIYDIETLTTFIANSLTLFNEIPYFTNFDFDDSCFFAQFQDIIVQGATLMALSSKALIERGREFSITDNGVNFVPPTISDLLNQQHNTEMAQHYEKLKYIKNSMRPSPQGLGTLTISTSRSPAISRLRMLRARQIY